jgi:hypothetical protein
MAAFYDQQLSLNAALGSRCKQLSRGGFIKFASATARFTSLVLSFGVLGRPGYRKQLQSSIEAFSDLNAVFHGASCVIGTIPSNDDVRKHSLPTSAVSTGKESVKE